MSAEPMVTSTLAKYLSGLDYADIPPRIIEEAKKLLLDSIVCMVTGAESELGPVIHAHAELFGEGDASVAETPLRASLLGAAYCNARLGTCLDFDETYPGGPTGGVHFGAISVAAALAVCERKKLGGAELLRAIVAGYELGGRIADVGTQLTFANGELVGRPEVWGMSVSAIFAAAGAAATACHLPEEQYYEALGLAGGNVQPLIGPLWGAMPVPPNVKFSDFGWSTAGGIFSAMAAQRGSTGAGPILDGKTSILHIIGIRKVNIDGLIGELGQRWALDDITYKPWPCCRFLHQAMTALKTIRDRHTIRAEDVDSIEVSANYALMSRRFHNREPSNFVARQFSFPHAIAMMLCDVPVGVDWVSEEVARRDDVVRIRNKVTVVDNPRARRFAQYFVRDQVRQMPGAITVHAGDRVYSAEADYALGDPWDPATAWSYGDVADKARLVTRRDPAAMERLVEIVRDIDSHETLDALMRELRGFQ